MSTSDFPSAFATASAAANAIRTKRISARDLIDLAFQRIDRCNPSLNAIVWQNRDSAMARAREADEALARGRAAGPLHGVPVTIKESFAYQGSPSTWGCPSARACNQPPNRHCRRPSGIRGRHCRWQDERACDAR